MEVSVGRGRWHRLEGLLRRADDLGWRLLRVDMLTMIEVRHITTMGFASQVFLEGLPQRVSESLLVYSHFLEHISWTCIFIYTSFSHSTWLFWSAVAVHHICLLCVCSCTLAADTLFGEVQLGPSSTPFVWLIQDGWDPIGDREDPVPISQVAH